MKSFPKAGTCFFRVIGVACSLFWLTSCAHKIGHSATPIECSPDMLIGEWIGFTEFDSTYYKLVLNADGTGTVYAQFSESVKLKQGIKRWRVEHQTALCDFQDIISQNAIAELRCRVNKSQLVGVVRGVRGWTEQVIFRKRSLLEQSLRNLDRP